MLLYMRQEGRGIGLQNKIHAYELQDDEGLDTVEANERARLPGRPARLRRRRADPRRPGRAQDAPAHEQPEQDRAGLEGYGLAIVERVPLVDAPNPHNESYLRAKRDRMGHSIHHQALALDEELVHAEHERDRELGRDVPGELDVSDARYAIAVGRFYEDLAQRLVAGAQRAFAAAGVGEADVYDVPGAYELPMAARYLADSGRYAGVACLGAVIRGETSHYDYVCAEAARGIQDVQLSTGVPCAFGVLTVENMEQALARTGGGKRDQGEHAAEAVLALAALRAQLA